MPDQKITDLLKEARDQAAIAEEDTKENRDKALEDIEFVFAEDQWDQEIKNARGNRPCLNANDLPVFLDQVTSEQRMERGGIEALPGGGVNTDPIKAEIMAGHVRYIEQVSDAHVAYDKALEFVTAGGYMGAIRVITQYESDEMFDDSGNIFDEYLDDPQSAFNQEIRIVPVDNPLNVLFDPSAKLWHMNDGRYLFYYDDIKIDEYKDTYPDKRTIDFEGEIQESLDWWHNTTDRTVRVAEWFRKESKGSKVLYRILTEDDTFALVTKVPDDLDPGRVIEEREVEDFRIVWRKISGVDILEGPIEIPFRLWPIVPVWGKEININGDRRIRGMFRYSKDPQRSYIYTQSAITELIALQPKNPYVGSYKMFENFEDKWKTLNTENRTYLPFSPDPDMVGMMPKREAPPQIPMGFVEQAQARHTEKKNVIGLQEATLGRASNETSGRAIRERRRGGDAVTYAYHDNLARARKQVGRVIGNGTPRIYSTKRIIMILGYDDKQTLQPINQKLDSPIKDNDGNVSDFIDFTKGKHDIIYRPGPGYANQRQEALDRLTEAMQYAPDAARLMLDVFVELLEIPGVGRKLAKRLEMTLPPEIRSMESGEENIMTPDKVQEMIFTAIEQFKQSEEGKREINKTIQSAEKTEQEKLQTQQEALKLLGGSEELKGLIAGIVRDIFEGNNQ